MSGEEWEIRERINEARETIREIVADQGLNPRLMIAVFHGATRCSSAGWWAVWGYVRVAEDDDQKFGKWCLTKRGATRAAQRNAQKLFAIRQSVLFAEMSGS